jgi:hypothetical protein
MEAQIERKIKAFNGLLLRNGGKSLVGRLLSIVTPLVGKVTRSSVAITCYFSFSVVRLIRNMGVKGAVLYLKACHVLMMQAIAKDKIKDQGPLKIRVKTARSGLPLIIPLLQRQKLLAGDVKVVRFWMSLFSCYRVMEFSGQPTIDTIISPGVDFTLDPLFPL